MEIVFVNVIKGRIFEVRSSQIRMDPKSSEGYPRKRWKTHKNTEGRPCEDEGRG